MTPSTISLQESQAKENDEFLVGFGYAPGNYSGTCIHGPHLMENVDKRAVRCREHAIFLLHQQLLITEIDNQEKAKQIEQHDARVSELLRAASREVIKRREINAHRMMLLRLVFKLRDQLRFYARQHRAKVDGFSNDLTLYDVERDPNLQEAVDQIEKQIIDTQTKAKVNDDLANECDEAIMWESPTGAMGTP